MIIEIPGVGNVEFPDDMPMDQITAALSQYRTQETVTQNPDGTYGQPPEGFVMNPNTGQMEDLRSPNNPNIPTGRAVALGVGAGQGLGFGSFDETVAAGNAAIGDSGYDYELARAREMDRRASEDHPGYYYTGMIPGAVASSLSLGKALGINPTGQTLGGTAVRGAGIGAGEGFLWGALNGEGGAGRVKNAIANALIGGGVGAAAPFAVAGGAKVYNAGRDLVEGGFDAMVGRANSGRANRAIMDTLKRAGTTVDDVADDVARAAREGQPEFRLMDATGKAGQRRASGVVRSGGDGAEELAQFLETRQLGQPERLGSFVDDAFGMGGKTAARTADDLKVARGAAADIAYDAARRNAAPVDVRGALSVIDDRIGGMQGSNVAGDGIDGALSRFRSRLAAQPAPNGEISRELSDFNRVLGVKQDVQDAIGVAVRAGRNNEARELSKLADALDQALEGASEGYRAANDGFRAASKVIGAVDEGAAMSRPSVRSADTIPAFQAMTPDEQAAARIGYGDRALAKLEAQTAPTANRAKAFASPKVAAETDAMALDPLLFKNRIGRETAMWETQNRALGGSRTADNLADQADLSLLSDAARAVKDGLMGRIGSAVGTVANRAGNVATGQNEATRSLVAKMLMSDNPRQALASALRQETTSQGRRRVVEALTRALGREFIPTP